MVTSNTMTCVAWVVRGCVVTSRGADIGQHVAATAIQLYWRMWREEHLPPRAPKRGSMPRNLTRKRMAQLQELVAREVGTRRR